MAAGTTAGPPTTNGTHSMANKPIELSLSLPHNPSTRIHLHLTILATNILLFVTSANLDAGSQTGAALGSFVYAMPDRYNQSQPLSTVLYSSAHSLDFTTRMAKVLARRTGKLCYVGGSVNLSSASGGGSVEEEMEALRSVVEVVTAEVAKASSLSNE